MATNVETLFRLKSQLLISGIQEKNQPLFQVINSLIDGVISGLAQVNTSLTGSGSGSGSGGALNASYLTIINETGILPNSRALIAGENIEFDDSVAGQRTINAILEQTIVREGQQIAFRQYDIEIGRQTTGKLTIRDSFETEHIGAPVFINQVPNKESDTGFIQFIGEITDTYKMDVYWMAPIGANRKVRISCLIGA